MEIIWQHFSEHMNVHEEEEEEETINKIAVSIKLGGELKSIPETRYTSDSDENRDIDLIMLLKIVFSG